MELPQLFLMFWVALVFWVLGQIWLVQIVVYPLFAKVGAVDYVHYHRFYTQRIPLPVIIPGFASFLLPVALALYGPTVPLWMSMLNIAAGIVGLLVTVMLEIPRHNRLEKDGKNDVTIAELIRYNWPRTLSISAQSVITFLMLFYVFGNI
ncbi:hypothetical protein C7293_08795 [filamentous cyanobacterium CCT1]|nr:hypothetical protein C7293_08795 [filamentous cyanobacterium CCT1]PSN79729.1 hypothetical protein C8B47_10220 [filamentous cyanobacterium CCP4]